LEIIHLSETDLFIYIINYALTDFKMVFHRWRHICSSGTCQFD